MLPCPSTAPNPPPCKVICVDPVLGLLVGLVELEPLIEYENVWDVLAKILPTVATRVLVANDPTGAAHRSAVSELHVLASHAVAPTRIA
eukprot:1822802-Rhodomonas_salina.1